MSSPSRTTRPDPSLGVFETLLVRDGRPLELDAHLARLDASARTLFGAPAPSTAPALVLEHARGEELARLRLTVAPDPEGPLVAEVVVARVDPSLVFPSRDRGVELAPVVVAGGIGAHKWADRRVLAGLEADVAPAVPLLLDGDGAALEASRANLFVVDDDTLVTPPADGRILPGITRARVLQLADALDVPVREEDIAFDSLSTATEVFITGAVRGIEPVRACDGAVVESGDRITAVLSRELDLLWQSVSNSTHLTSRQQELYDFIVSELVTGQGIGSITVDEDLIRRGVIDSLGVQQLVDFCQSRYGIRVSDADLVPENFQTLRQLAYYADRKQAEARSSGWRGLRSRNR